MRELYKSNENHAAGMVYAQQQEIFNAILTSTLPVIRIDSPFDLYTEKLVQNYRLGALSNFRHSLGL